MGWLIVIGFLASFGAVSIAWCLLGWLLPDCRDGWLLYPGRRGDSLFVEIYLWLRGVGLVNCPLLLMDLGLSEGEKRRYRSCGIEICSPEEVPDLLRIGANST